MTGTKTTEAPATAKKAAAKRAPRKAAAASKKATATTKATHRSEPAINPAEDAVRTYLKFLADPSSLVDTEAIAAAEAAVAASNGDPIAKLKAIAAREELSTPDATPIRSAFFEHAKTWATEHGISAKLFATEFSVPTEDLMAAGFDVREVRPTVHARVRNSGQAPKRAKAVPVEDIQAWVRKTKGRFILTDVIAGIGGSQATIRKGLDEMIEAGELNKLGAKTGYEGRGRAPIEYEMIPKS